MGSSNTRRPAQFRLPGDLLDRLRAAAAERGCTQTDLVEAGLVLALADPPASRVEAPVRAVAGEDARRSVHVPGPDRMTPLMRERQAALNRAKGLS